ncbi:hypothetical protein [Nocardia sp. NPDC058480]|uniref:hypothetical protein n=1 Tax=Nocardia sp. NPDC058480 TaxID=3346522 RepID=UPI003663E50C
MSNAIDYSIGPFPGQAEDQHRWIITDTAGEVASLYADLNTGEINSVDVRADRRREGIARRLYEAAVAQVDIYHAPDVHCTPEGLAFKNAMGGETIPDELAYFTEWELNQDEEI